jgi:2-keto-3-deoxy-L-rhamnonate aldolase RhmA
MTLCLITDDVPLAREAEAAGIDRVVIDLERDGKAERQAGRHLFLSGHRLEAVAPMRRALHVASLLVRVNPLSHRSAGEVDAVIDAGADLVMLPYFHRADEVRRFVSLVRGRGRVVLLVETRSAVDTLDAIVQVPGVDEIHIGLNDLSISLAHRSLFEPMTSGLVDRVARIIRDAGIPFGVGGLARLSARDLPVSPERMLAEQIRLGATCAWLGRTFRGDLERARRDGELAAEVAALRASIAHWHAASTEALRDNHVAFCRDVEAWHARAIGA